MRTLTLIVLLFLFNPCAAQSPTANERPVDEVPFVVTPPHIVERMLELAQLSARDRLVDLGSGDGRIVIAAARRGAGAVGFEIDDALVKDSQTRAKALGLEARAAFFNRDIFDADYSGFDVVTMYLLPEFNEKLRPKLLKALKSGSRIVSHEWDMGPWVPDETLFVRAPTKPLGNDRTHRVYLWVVPANIAGRWVLEMPTQTWRANMELQQTFQAVEGTIANGQLRSFALRGNTVDFVANVNGQTWRFRGQVDGSTLRGTAGRISEEIGTTPWSARWVE